MSLVLADGETEEDSGDSGTLDFPPEPDTEGEEDDYIDVQLPQPNSTTGSPASSFTLSLTSPTARSRQSDNDHGQHRSR